VRLDLEEDALILAVLGICAWIDPVCDTSISPRPGSPHISHMRHRESNHGLEPLGEVVVECAACPDRPLLEQSPQCIDTFLVHCIQTFVGGNIGGLFRNVRNGNVDHGCQSLGRGLEIEQSGFAVYQSSLDGWVLAVAAARVSECWRDGTQMTHLYVWGMTVLENMGGGRISASGVPLSWLSSNCLMDSSAHL
jgi:hypothetical protein